MRLGGETANERVTYADAHPRQGAQSDYMLYQTNQHRSQFRRYRQIQRERGRVRKNKKRVASTMRGKRNKENKQRSD